MLILVSMYWWAVGQEWAHWVEFLPLVAKADRLLEKTNLPEGTATANVRDLFILERWARCIVLLKVGAGVILACACGIC